MTDWSTELLPLFKRVTLLLMIKEKIMQLILKSTATVFIARDIHGTCKPVNIIIETFEKALGDKKDAYLVFLGDILDRGNESLECLYKVLSIFEKYPDRVIVLKGNHELLHVVNGSYGNVTFEGEIHEAFCDMVNEMPISCILEIGNIRYFLSHASFPSTSGNFDDIKDLSDIIAFNSKFEEKAEADKKFKEYKNKIINTWHEQTKEFKDDEIGTPDKVKEDIEAIINVLRHFAESEYFNKDKIRENYRSFARKINEVLTEKLEDKDLSECLNLIMRHPDSYYDGTFTDKLIQTPLKLYGYEKNHIKNLISAYKKIYDEIDQSTSNQVQTIVPSDTPSFILRNINIYNIKKIEGIISDKKYCFDAIAKLFDKISSTVITDSYKQIMNAIIDDLQDHKYDQKVIDEISTIINSPDTLCPNEWGKFVNEWISTIEQKAVFMKKYDQLKETLERIKESYLMKALDSDEYNTLMEQTYNNEWYVIVECAVWLDIYIKKTKFKGGYRGESRNGKITFEGLNHESFASLMKRCGINCFIRGHEVMPNCLRGYDFELKQEIFSTKDDESHTINNESSLYIALHSTIAYAAHGKEYSTARALIINSEGVQSITLC